MKRVLVLLVVALMAYSCSMTPSVKVTMENSTDVNRQEEMVEVDIAELNTQLEVDGNVEYVVYNSKRKEIPSQVTYDGKLIFQATIAPMSKETYRISVGEPKEYESKVFGRQFPESNDDFTWENDLNAVRIYGPATQASGQRLYGYDIWTKSTPDLVVEGRYAKALDEGVLARVEELRANGQKVEADKLYATISYEADHGNGLDAYNVGPSLGGGCAALMERGRVIYPQSYESYEILDNGPLRLSVKFTYPSFAISGKPNVVETRIHVVDAGTCFTKSYISYTDLTRPTPILAGIVMARSKSKQLKVSKDEGYAVYADADRRNLEDGVIYVGTIFPEMVKSVGVMPFTDGDEERAKMGLTGHLVLISDYKPKSEFVYYWGSMWEKYKIATFDEWVSYVADRSAMVRNPLVITMK